MNGLVFEANVKTNYVIYDDLDTPIHSYLYRAIRYSIDPEKLLAKAIKLDRNEFERQDNILQLFNGPEKVEYLSYNDRVID